jgi:sulfate transport system ATP-binding protein
MSVELTGLTCQFASVTAVRDISLSAVDGEFLAVLGPSGSGKTTLLRLIAGLDRPDCGHIAIDGRNMDDVPAQRRGVGFVFQHYALFRHMSVAENIAFGLRVRPRAVRPPRQAIRKRVQELLELVQLPDLGGRYPDQLSGGQRQRVALARALAIDPRLLLLDEPFGALDAPVRKDLRRWLRRLHDRTRLTTLLVTHDQGEALELADRVAVLRAGRLEQVDTPRTLLAMPASAFVYAFLGDSERFECVVQQGRARFERLPLPPLPAALPDGPALAMIRPYEIRVSADASGPARVVSVVPEGAMLRVGLTLAGAPLEAVVPTEAPVPQPGAACALDLSRARIYPREA